MKSEESAARGTGWVIGQVVLFGLIVLLPPNLGGLPALHESGILAVVGVFVGVVGVLLVVFSSLNLGSNLTIFPRPLEDATLIQTGIYGLVRHPIYFGAILGALGWSLMRASLPSLLVTLVLGIFFDQKANREEQWLLNKFPDYADYRQRVHKLIPWLY